MKEIKYTLMNDGGTIFLTSDEEINHEIDSTWGMMNKDGNDVIYFKVLAMPEPTFDSIPKLELSQSVKNEIGITNWLGKDEVPQPKKYQVGIELEWYNPKTNISSLALPEITGLNDTDGCYLRPIITNNAITVTKIIS